MKVNSAKLKYKSSVNLYFAICIALFQIVILLLLTSPIFAFSKLGLKCGIFLLAVDVIVFLPMFFKVCYEFHDTELYVCDWPFGHYKIPYDCIVSVGEKEVDAKASHVKKVGLSTKRIVLEYSKLQKDKSGQTETVTAYMLISPAEEDSFILFLKNKMNKASANAAKVQDAVPEKTTETGKTADEETALPEKKEADKKIKSAEKSDSTKPKSSVEPCTQEEAEQPVQQTEQSNPTETESKKGTAPQAAAAEEIEAPSNENQAYFIIEDDEEKPL